MSKWIVISALFVSSLAASSAFAARPPVLVCTQDKVTADSIAERDPKELLTVYNEKNEVVGALAYHEETGDLNTLYLCGYNSGIYYVDGNLNGAELFIYNDEHDSQTTVEDLGHSLKVTTSIAFLGEPEDADYGPFTAVFYVQKP